MKRILLSLMALVLGTYVSTAQWSYLSSYHDEAGNPGGIHTGGDTESSGWKEILDDNLPSNQWGVVDTIPFPFDFFGTPVSYFKVSANGILSFDTTVTTADLADLNYNLPSDSLPAMSIAAFWDEFTASAPTGFGDDVITQTFGTAPNRQFWIKWFSFEMGNPTNSFNYFSIVLEEGTNKIYVVDMYANSTNGLTSTVGLQQNSSMAVQYGDSTLSNNGNGSSNTDNDYYEFEPVLLLPDNIGVEALVSPSSPLTPGSQPVTVEVRNHGTNSVTSFIVNWSVNGMAQTPFFFSGTLASQTSTNINLGNYNFGSGMFDIQAYTEFPNGNADADPSNDTLNASACTGLSGAFTVGPTGSYLTLQDAMADLTLCGLGCPVSLDLSPGTHAGGIIIPELIGSSATNTLTIDGGSSATTEVTHDGTGANAVFQLESADYVTISNLKITNTGTDDSWGIHLSDSADYNTISNCYINMVVSPGIFDVASIVVSGDPTNDFTEGKNASYLTIISNKLRGGERGIVMEGDDIDSTYYGQYNIIMNNEIYSVDDYGIYMDNQTGISIIGNTIDSIGSNFGDGIYIFDIQDFTITENRVTAPDYGLYISDGNFDFGHTQRGQVINNMVYSATDRAFHLDDVEFTDFWHNTGYGTPGAYFNDLVGTSIRNNIFASAGDYAVESFDSLGTEDFDHNLYYNTSGDLIRSGSNYFADLASWQAHAPHINVNSVSGDPVFKSATDLHVLGTAANDVADPTLGVFVDIDGETRPLAPSTIPDIGADEYKPLEKDAFAVNVFIDGSGCGTDSNNVYVVFGSQGINPVDTADIDVVVDLMGSQVNISTTYIGNLSFPDYDTVHVGHFSSTAGGTYDITATLTVTDDDDLSNQSVSNSFRIGGTDIPYGMGGTGCANGTGFAYATDGPKAWHTDSVGGTYIGAGDSIWVNMGASDTTIWVGQMPLPRALTTTMEAGNGCSGGNMFDLITTADIVIDSLWVHTTSTSQMDVKVYYMIDSSYLGKETADSLWTLHDSISTMGAGSDNPTSVPFSKPLAVPAGVNYAIYVEYDARYTTGANTYSDNFITVSAGSGLCGSFSGVNHPRTFNGTIHYNTGACTDARTPVTIGVTPGVNNGFNTNINNYTVNFTGSVSSADSVMWDFGDGNTSTMSNPTNTYATAGTYYVCYTTYGGPCGAETVCDSVVVECIPPSADYNYNSANGTVTFTDASTNADNVSWDFGDGNTSTQTNPVHTYAANGQYIVCQIASSVCGSDTTCYTITITGLGIEDELGVNSMYPNPVVNNLTIDLNAQHGDIQLKVLDLQGRIVAQEVIAAGTTKHVLDLAHLENGTYMVQFNSNGQTSQQAIIKQD